MRYVLTLVLLPACCGSTAFAQATPLAKLNKGFAPPTAWMQYSEQQLTKATVHSDDYMSALLVRCLAVYNQDRQLATRFCLDAERVGSEANNRGVVAAARMVRAESLADLGQSGREEYESASEMFDPETATPDAAMVYHLSRNQFERLAGETPDTKREVAGAWATLQVQNKALRLTGQIFQRLISVQASVSDKTLQTLLEQSRTLPFCELSAAVEQMAILKSELDEEKKIEHLIELLKRCDARNPSRSLKSSLMRAIVDLQLKLGEYDNACEYVNRLCTTARDLQSSTHLSRALALKIDSEIGHQRMDLAEPAVVELRELLPGLHCADARASVHRALLSVAIERNDKDRIYELSGLLGSTLAQQQENLTIRESILAELENLREQSEETQRENDSLAADQAVARRRIQRYQWISLLIVSTLAVLLYISRMRMKRAHVELREQIKSNQRSQKLQEELTDRVAQVERMESLGALAGGIAHDFNNLLVGVVCNAEVLQMYHDQTPQSEKCLDGILKAAETASDLSRKMLAYAGRQPSEKRAADLNQLVHPIVSLAQSGLIDSNIQFVASDAPAVARVDETQIEQVVLNLLNNAREAMANRDGNITVTVGTESIHQSSIDPFLIGAAQPVGDYVYIEVSDCGAGVNPDDIHRIFEPFQSSNSQRGRGMGLAVVYGHVNRHDGLIRVRSEPGEGTVFRVLLPRSDSLPEENRVLPSEFDLPASGYVLFVDDEDIIRDVATRFIEQVNWQVTTCSSGEEAIEFFRNTDQMPDCICLDVVMPEIDGAEVVQQLDAMGVRVPIIMMSGYSTTNHEELLEHNMISDFLSKPFNTEQLLAAISHAISRQDGSPAEHATSPVGSKLK